MENKKPAVKKVICPECENEVVLLDYENIKVGDIIECQYCGSDLEVVSVENGEVKVELIEEEK